MKGHDPDALIVLNEPGRVTTVAPFGRGEVGGEKLDEKITRRITTKQLEPKGATDTRVKDPEGGFGKSSRPKIFPTQDQVFALRAIGESV